MRRLPRIPLWVGTALAGAAIGAAVAVLVMAGAPSGGARHAEPTPAQRLHDARRAEIARAKAFERAELRLRLEAAQIAVRRAQACHHSAPTTGNLPRERYRRAVRIALRYLGTPYVWGGASPSGFDTSGFVMYVYGKLGVSLPHYTVGQYCASKVHPSRSHLKPGDLVFFFDRSHVGIYVGNNQFVHAPHTGAVVRIETLTGQYRSEYYGATRILG